MCDLLMKKGGKRQKSPNLKLIDKLKLMCKIKLGFFVFFVFFFLRAICFSREIAYPFFSFPSIIFVFIVRDLLLICTDQVWEQLYYHYASV